MILDNQDFNKVWFTADHHFGHANIIQFCNRPFANIKEMDRALIENWNEVIGPKDVVFHLGDFTLGKYDWAREYFSRLNGLIYILKNDWHHDRRWIRKQITTPNLQSKDDSVMLLPPLFVLEIPKLGKEHYPLAITLCHYPMAEWDRKHYGAWHLHGHSHGRYQYQADDYAIDVGVDAMNYYPINLNGVLTLMYERGWVQG